MCAGRERGDQRGWLGGIGVYVLGKLNGRRKVRTDNMDIVSRDEIPRRKEVKR